MSNLDLLQAYFAATFIVALAGFVYLVFFYVKLRTRTKILLSALLVMAIYATESMGQYSTTHVKYPVDITSNTTSGTNAWKYLFGNPVCLPKSVVTGADLSTWCLGTNHYVYKYNLLPGTWIQQTAMGTSLIALAVRSKNEIYGLIPGTCSGGPGVVHWTGTLWEGPNGCLVQLSVGWNGDLTGVNNANNKFTAPYTSSFGSRQWNYDGGSWSYSSLWGAGFGCAVTTGGQVNLIGPAPITSPWAMPSIPSGTPLGCVLFYDDNGTSIMAWNGSGTVYMIDIGSSELGWSTVAGPPITQIGGYQKAWLMGIDSSGKPYHWNVYAMYVASTTSGTFTQCPGIPQIQCHTNQPIHAGYLRTRFSSGHGLNYNAGIQSTLVAPQSQMNLTSYDINPQCDPLLGHPDDPECTSDTYGYEHCNQAGADLPNNPTQNPDDTPGESVAISGFVRTNSETGPHPTGWSTPIDGAWYGIVNRNYYDACFEFGANEPTCPEDYSQPFNKIMLQAYHSAAESDLAYDEIYDMLTRAVVGADMPIIVWQPYTKKNGVVTCSGQRREQETFGFLPDAVPGCN